MPFEFSCLSTVNGVLFHVLTLSGVPFHVSIQQDFLMFSHNILVNALKNNYIMETSGIFGSASRTTSVAAPVTDMVDIENGAIVISVVENRAREICICKINTRNVSTQ